MPRVTNSIACTQSPCMHAHRHAKTFLSPLRVSKFFIEFVTQGAKRFFFLLPLFMLLLVTFSPFAFAQTAVGTNPPSTGVPLPNPLGVTTILDFLQKLYDNFLIFVAPPLAVALFVWGAFLFLTSAGNEDRVKSGKATMLWTAVGFGLLLMVEILAKLIADLLH